MYDYPELQDEQLQSLSQSGDENAGSELTRRYKPLIKRCARPYFLLGGDAEDLIQEGMIGLVHSIKSYDPLGGASFRSYAEICIRRCILDAIKSAGRLKHMPLNTGLSLDVLFNDENASKASIAEMSYSPSPEELILERERKSNLYSISRNILSPLERKVLAGYLEGLSYEEIAALCSKPVKSVDSALQRIKKKLSVAMNSGL